MFEGPFILEEQLRTQQLNIKSYNKCGYVLLFI